MMLVFHSERNGWLPFAGPSCVRRSSSKSLGILRQRLRTAGCPFHPETLCQEHELVRDLLDTLRSRLIASVPAALLDSQEHRHRTRLGVLKGGGELETVQRGHAVVGVPGGHQRRGIPDSFLDVM